MNNTDAAAVNNRARKARRRDAASQPFGLIFSNWPLISILTQRELRDRYTGTVLGGFWAILQPLLLLAILAVVFSYLFQIRRGTPGVMELPSDYASYMIAGFVPWYALSSALLASASVMRANAGLVKQIDFPLAILPVKVVMTQVPLLAIGIAGLFLYQLIRYQHVSGLILLLPLLVILLFMLAAGLAWLVAALGAYFRDAEPIMANLFMVAFYLLPIFFMPGFMPAILEPLVMWNPFSPLVMAFQDVLVFGAMRAPFGWLFLVFFSVVAFFGGFKLFDRARHGFSAVI